MTTFDNGIKNTPTMTTNLTDFMLENDKLEDIIHALDTNGLILFPTDTIWGIGCDATNAEAVDKVYQLKQRDPSKPFILLADSIEMVKDYVDQVHPRIDTLLVYHTRPLTVIYDKARNLPSNLVATDQSIGIRIPQDPFCKNLIKAYGKPLVATSANISNEPFPSNFGEISSAVIKGVDYVVKHRQQEKTLGEPSVIVRVSEKGELIFLR